MKKKSNPVVRSLLTGAMAATLLAAAFFGIRGMYTEGGIPGLLRANHELAGWLWGGTRQSPPRVGAPAGAEPRVNGDLGLEDEQEAEDWKLKVYAEDKLLNTLELENLRALPRTDTATQFYCIEGWSTTFSYAGVRFSDFAKTYALDTSYKYVGLETPDGKYYVSLDMDSMLHPQTLLAYEMNERPLSQENGFPLRLVIPIKYGIKSLKRIGSIRLSNTRPRDYWAERGYDWFSAL